MNFCLLLKFWRNVTVKTLVKTKNLNSQWSQKLFNHAKESTYSRATKDVTDAFKISKLHFKHFPGNSRQNSLETVKSNRKLWAWQRNAKAANADKASYNVHKLWYLKIALLLQQIRHDIKLI